MKPLTYETLAETVAGAAVGFRAVTRLEPLGGPGDKLFPPTFGNEVTVPTPTGADREDRRRTKYALEWRRIKGAPVLCVVLDSVASQANRLELALLDGWDRGELAFPLVRVDFTGETDENPALDLSTLGGDGYITSLEAPHRLADALLRDSLLDGRPFRLSEPGRRFTEASPANAAPLFELDPISLVLGLWDSTGPKGGLGAKFQRALVSEIVGVGAELGTKSASRIDPTGIEKTEIYEAADPEEVWTTDPEQAKGGAKKPTPLKRGGEKAGSPSVINHGNVMPSTDPVAGGVTIDYAEQVTVLSLPALRRLRFPKCSDGSPIDAGDRRRAEDAARTALAALGLAAVACQRENGYDLRSRCALRPLSPLQIDLLPGDGSDPRSFSLDAAGARELLHQAADSAAKAGLPWSKEPLTLKPAPKLVGLIRRSREKTVAEEADA
ncbi:MAG TPA: type I-U CRISPR-associated RAMP protein Csb1/Cas7u [Thermoanaerobaculia bacterium]|nr:type I-U CRISPR-associated RAMP protein Csb1/Cas7u [Thermoanaerobaculia bacterium]